jgi:hypothetical protein
VFLVSFGWLLQRDNSTTLTTVQYSAVSYAKKHT